jgi:hypothetical protein
MHTLADYLSGKIKRSGKYFCFASRFCFSEVDNLLMGLTNLLYADDLSDSYMLQTFDIYDTKLEIYDPLSLESVKYFIDKLSQRSKSTKNDYRLLLFDNLLGCDEFKISDGKIISTMDNIVAYLLTDVDKYYPQYSEFICGAFSTHIDIHSPSNYLFTVVYEDLVPYVE